MTSIQDSPSERNIVQALSTLKRGSYLLKYGRWGKPKFCPFHLSTDATTLIWYAGKEEKKLRLSQVSKIIPGQRTANFQRYPQPEKEFQSFSLIYGKNSLDVICKDKYEAEIWLVALQALISGVGYKNRRTEIKTEGTFSDSPTDSAGLNSQYVLSKRSDDTVGETQNHQLTANSFVRSPERKRGRLLSDFLSHSDSSQCSPESESLPCSPTHSYLDDVSSRNSVDTTRASFCSVLSASFLEYPPEDIPLSNIFIWGEGIDCGPLGGGIQRAGESFRNKESFLPKVLESGSVLESQYIACGRRHAVLISREGQIYSWGDGTGGKLGHGIEADIFNPKLVDTLGEVRIVSAGCGEYHTCAITANGDLYTWGDGIHNFGLLGHGTEVSYWTPRKVRGQMDGIHVTAVSCGPWHSAAVTSIGQLFTFGDGTFGALGHGNRFCSNLPREVEALKGQNVMAVSCGFWHTAAIVEVPSESPASRIGKLFTWGNGNEGQLGHGDKLLQLVPLCVSLPNDLNLCQVACGQSITTALTICGKLYGMGSSCCGELGYPGNTHAIPVRIEGKLKNCFIEEISCGSHHVVALTSKSEVFLWGRGRNGQLGHGDNADRSSPTLVEALKGKQVKKVFCGNNFTAAICLHQRVSAADYLVCAGCQTAFSFRIKRHNCYNCGLVFCKACTNKKSLNASLAPNMNKLYRVCEDCFGKLNKGVDTKVSSRPPRYSSQCGHGDPKKPKEYKRKKSGIFPRISSYDSFRKSHTQLSKKNHKLYPSKNQDSETQVKDIECDKSSCVSSPSTSTFDCNDIMNISLPSSRMQSRTSSPVSTQSSPAHAISRRLSFAGGLDHQEVVDDTKKTDANLQEEISILREQVEVLERKSQFLASELERTSGQLEEANAWFQDEHKKNNAAKEEIECLMRQLKEIAIRVPQGFSCRASGPFADDMCRALSTAAT